ncbi:hypothetical protein [Microbacterium sp. JZ37]|uniref:hypothetical protein n=1 Tax=Microbacterium sp. JZ37 TaxID=2654193 RepID=UPI002B49AB29|nr:hypothetical protein [Microbacterium sp. JZ37]WRH18719.1 hypothetical protein GC092_15135 [Microbacterium sp. JZ37]
MTKTLRALSGLAGAIALLALASCASPASEEPAESAPAETPAAETVVDGACADDEGITLIVDSTALEGGERSERCVLADEPQVAADVLAEAGVETEGTEEYGDEVLCRVDGLPSATEPVGSTEGPAYVEECASMPAAFAYWSIWIQPADGEWGYAMEGLSTQEVAPGESLELLFALDGAPAAP